MLPQLASIAGSTGVKRDMWYPETLILMDIDADIHVPCHSGRLQMAILINVI
jgi:hypothetical protein